GADQRVEVAGDVAVEQPVGVAAIRAALRTRAGRVGQRLEVHAVQFYDREPVFAEDLRVQVRAAQTGHAALPRLARHLVHGRALGRLEVELRVTWRGEGDLLEPDVERRRSRAVRIDRDPQRRAVVGVDGDGDLADQRTALLRREHQCVRGAPGDRLGAIHRDVRRGGECGQQLL